MRLLTNFFVYDSSTGRPVEMATLEDSELEYDTYAASGIVRPWLEPDEDDEYGDVEPGFGYPRVQLSRLLELNTHHYNDGAGSFDG